MPVLTGSSSKASARVGPTRLQAFRPPQKALAKLQILMPLQDPAQKGCLDRPLLIRVPLQGALRSLKCECVSSSGMRIFKLGTFFSRSIFASH